MIRVQLARRLKKAPFGNVCPAKEGKVSGMQNERLRQIDDLRGIAAVLVMLFHYFGSSLPKLSFGQSTELFSFGWVGVEIFFVISGFVIPYSYFKRVRGFSGLLAFYKGRFIRIALVSYVALALYLALYLIIDSLKASDTIWFKFTAFDMISNLLFAVPLVGGSWINGVFWTLSIEFQFYLFVLPALLILREASLVMLAGILFCLISTMFEESATIVHYFPFFFFGIIVYYFQVGELKITFALFCILICALCALSSGPQISTVFALGSVLYIIAVRHSFVILRFIGKISFSLYLMHVLLGTLIESMFVRVLGIQSDSLMETILLVFVVANLSILFSYFFYLRVERPLTLWSKNAAA